MMDMDHPNVILLRRFRDERLERYTNGMAFVQCYYKIGPIIARSFSARGWSGKVIRFILDGVCWLLRKLGGQEAS